MLSTVKKWTKKLFPNLIDNIILEKRKFIDFKRMNHLKGKSEEDYVEILSDIYLKKTGNDLNIVEPRRFTEKIQWRKLFDQDPVYSELSDKYKVRKWVEKKIGSEHLIPLLDAWERFDELDIQSLPDQFVIKTNNASHTNMIFTSKKEFIQKKRSVKRCIKYWLTMPFSYLEGLELHYQKIKPMIIAEKYLSSSDGKSSLSDYKFHCFNGDPYICQVIADRFNGETIDFYDKHWEHLDIRRPPYRNSTQLAQKPNNYDLMIQLATKLSKGFQYVRVDLYEHENRVYFGEMTFTPASGMMKFDPDAWDYRLGQLWDIHSQQIDKAIVNLDL